MNEQQPQVDRRESNKTGGEKKKSIAVVGGGITGLSAAYFASRCFGASNVHLFEATSRVGGVIQSQQVDQHLIELGPDMFTTKLPDAFELCSELGIRDRLVPTNTQRRGAYIVKRGRLIRVPDGMALMAPHKLGSILKTPLLSWFGRARLLSEAMIRPRRDTVDESLASFARRRFGKEAYDWLIQPLVSGIYTADPNKLSMRATMNEFLEMEKESGSLIRAAMKKSRSPQQTTSEANASGARYGLFLACDEGMELLTQRLQDQLPPSNVHLNSAVDRLEYLPTSRRWRLSFSHLPAQEFDGVVLALRAFDSAKLLQPTDRELADSLSAIPYASTAVAVLVLPRDAIAHPIEAFGIVAPLAEQRKMIAASFANHKFPGRAPDEHVICRVFIGGACQPELLELSDEQLVSLAQDELTDLIGLSPDAVPIRTQVVRWNRAMPQYVVGHHDRITQIEEKVASLPQIELAGNAYRGVGIPQCVRSARQAIERLSGGAIVADANQARASKSVETSL